MPQWCYVGTDKGEHFIPVPRLGIKATSARGERGVYMEERTISYRTVEAFKADFGEFWDTLYLTKVCLEHQISYEISPE